MRAAVFLLALFGAGLPASPSVAGTATTTAQAPAKTAQIDVYEYVDDAVYTVRTGMGITTQIELDPAAEILDFSSGFSSGWDLSRRGNVFYLRPRDVDVDTNLLVRTRDRAYIFELKVVATDWTSLEQARRAGVQYKVGFRYPADAGFAAAVEDPPASGQSAALEKGRSYNFAYEAASRHAPAWLVPVHVYDDGRFTYLRMGGSAALPTGSFPAVFARRERDGEEFVVNTTVEGGVLVVHGAYPFLVIRHGRHVLGLRRGAR